MKTAVLAGEGLLSSKLHEIWQHSVCRKALKGWLLSAQASIAYREVIRNSLNKWRYENTYKFILRHLTNNFFLSNYRFEAVMSKQMKIADSYCKRRQLKNALSLWKGKIDQGLYYFGVGDRRGGGGRGECK